jgi:PIN domain nuclease of toxin-antitoxin system
LNLLLDTCATLWIANGDTIAARAQDEIAQALGRNDAVYVSPITAWEIGLLAARGRISLRLNPLRWFDKLMRAPGLALATLEVDVLVASSFLPDCDLRDPADRIIVATAREYDYRIVTRDRIILAYAERGLCRAIPC